MQCLNHTTLAGFPSKSPTFCSRAFDIWVVILARRMTRTAGELALSFNHSSPFDILSVCRGKEDEGNNPKNKNKYPTTHHSNLQFLPSFSLPFVKHHCNQPPLNLPDPVQPANFLCTATAHPGLAPTQYYNKPLSDSPHEPIHPPQIGRQQLPSF